MSDAVAFVSAHLDDAAFSCGGTISACAREERAVVATIFAAPLDLDSPLAQARRFHLIMGVDAATDPRLRHDEDERAMRRLGATPIHLDFSDCIYRVRPDGTPVVVVDEDLFSDEETEESLPGVIADRLAAALMPFSPRSLVLPLGLGGHRDHRLARRAGEEVGGRLGTPVSYYEDVPYCLRPGGAPCEAHLEPVLVPLTEADMAARLEAAAEYRSQRQVAWNEAEPLGEAIVRYAASLGRRVGGGRLAERLWRHRG